MDRKLKFRVWNPDVKNWQRSVLFESDDFKSERNFKAQILIEAPLPMIVQQFTGVRDKNNKEIYEGDIVLTEGNPNNESGDGNILLVVEYRGSGFVYRDLFDNQVDSIYSLIGDSDHDPDSEIVGNIFENPEALGK